MTDQDKVQEAPSQSTNPQGDVSEDNNQASPFESLTKEQLVEQITRLDSRIHEVNNESKQRKIKLRELETQREQDRELSLKEKEEYKTLYEDLKEKTNDYTELLSFKESHLESEKTRLVELEKQLTAEERQELNIFGEIPIDKKLQWVDMKLKNRNRINIDSSSSIQAGGSLKAQPKNRRELARLSSDDQKSFKARFPELFQVAIKTP